MRNINNERIMELKTGIVSENTCHLRIKYLPTEVCEELTLSTSCVDINNSSVDIEGVYNLPKKFIIPKENKKLRVVDNAIYSYDYSVFMIHAAMDLPYDCKIQNGVKHIQEDAFYGQHFLRHIDIPESIETIGREAFKDCDSLQSISLPIALKDLNGTVFRGCRSMENISISSDNQYFTTVNGVLYSKDMKTLIYYPSGKIDEEYTIPDGVEVISFSAFNETMNLKTLILPTSIKCIEDKAITFCHSLRDVSIPNVPYSIGWMSFANCENLELVTLGDQVISINDHAFVGCKSLSTNNISRKIFDRIIATKKDCEENKLGVKIKSNIFAGTPVLKEYYRYRILKRVSK